MDFLSNQPNRKTLTILFLLILAMGVFARTWEYNQLPSGLHRDEASHAYDAYSVFKYGEDRNGVHYPLQFVSWGDGQTVLYPYLAIPFMAVLGLTPLAIRLPNLIAGILIIPLAFLTGRRMLGGKFGLLVMFLMAISPWNIIGSRWGLEPYFLPFLFLLGFYFLLRSTHTNYWFVPAAFTFGLCLYVYSTSFSAIPIFLALALPVLIQQKRVSWKSLAVGLLVFIILAIPNILYVYINITGHPSLRLWPFTIPHLPLQPRFANQVALFSPEMLSKLLDNITVMARVLWTQTDGWLRNDIPPYGYGYPLAALLSIAGLLLVVLKKELSARFEMSLMGIWVIAGFSIGALQGTNINRICFIFIPMMVFGACLLLWLSSKWKPLLPAVAAIYLVLFSAFTAAYHSPAYKQYTDLEFNSGLLESIHYASQSTTADVCVPPQVYRGYVFVLFSETPDPRQVVSMKKDYVNPWNPFDKKGPFARYKVSASQCKAYRQNALIIRSDEPLPSLTGSFAEKDFGIYRTFVPAQ
jgi:4-amino-4-deoxy-L-arabinose transferase-like glycosyltransferase